MNEPHFCSIHGCKFFENQGKDGKPNWWSHKVQGTNPAQYCNEKKKKEIPTAQPEPRYIDLGAGKDIDEVEKIFTDKPKTAAIPVVGKEIRSTRDQSIDEAVAIKAIVELACGKVIEPTAPLVRAVRDWCADKLKNYISPVKEQPARDKSVDQKMLYSLIKSHLKFTTDKAVENWLENVVKIDMTRVQDEPDKVFTEIEFKQGWDK